MTPHALPDSSFFDLVKFAPRATNHLALLDDERFVSVYEAVVALILDFLRYATAYEQGAVAELLNDEPHLAILGQALLGEVPSGIIATTESTSLWLTFERHGIVVEKLALRCNS